MGQLLHRRQETIEAQDESIYFLPIGKHLSMEYAPSGKPVVPAKDFLIIDVGMKNSQAVHSATSTHLKSWVFVPNEVISCSYGTAFPCRALQLKVQDDLLASP